MSHLAPIWPTYRPPQYSCNCPQHPTGFTGAQSTALYDTWEDQHLSADIIQEYEDEQHEIEREKRHPAPVPFAVLLAKQEDESNRELSRLTLQ